MSEKEGVVVPAVGRIFVGWDGSADAERALQFAAHLGAGLHAEVTALAVLKRPAHVECADVADAVLANRRRQALEQLGAALDGTGGPAGTYRPDVIAGGDDTATELARYADKHSFDLLIVGRHGVDQAVHPRLGRVTGHLVASSHCPVVVVAEDHGSGGA